MEACTSGRRPPSVTAEGLHDRAVVNSSAHVVRCLVVLEHGLLTAPPSVFKHCMTAHVGVSACV